MPTYNGEAFLAAALESVERQFQPGIELIVVDDGSSDRTVRIVRDFATRLPIKLLTPGRLGSWVKASNLGLREARAPWAAFLHQDDLWFPERIASLRSRMDHAEGALVVHNAAFIGPDGRRLGPWTCPFREQVIPSGEFVERLLIQNFIAMPSPVFDRAAAVNSGGLDESLWFTADWDLWLRLAALGPVGFVNRILAAFRLHPESQTFARQTQPGEWSRQLTTVMRRHLGNWSAPEERKRRVESAAEVSIAISSLLSAASRGQAIHPLRPLLKLLALGPGGWRRYFRDSRIVQRTKPRLGVWWAAHFG